MGLSSSKSKTTSTQTVAPSTYNQPYIDAAAKNFAPDYAAASANNASLMPGVQSVIGYAQDELGGKYLNGNPYLDGVIGSANRDITTGVNSQFEGAGRYGSGAHTGVLARALADNENKLRFTNYANERANQGAAGQHLLAATGVAAGLPQMAGSTYADQVARLLGGYNTSTGSGTQTTNQSPLLGLAGLAGAGLSGWASGGFKGI